MKKLLFLTVLLTSTVLFAGEKSNVKIKFHQEKVKFFNIPEIFSDVKHENIFINIIDENNVSYNSSDIVDPNFIYKFISYTYPLDSSHYIIKVERLSSTKVPGYILSFKTIKNKKGEEVKIFYQQHDYKQEYKIKVFDVLDNNKNIYDKSVIINGYFEYPNDVKGINKCYDKACAERFSYKKLLNNNHPASKNLVKKLEKKATLRTIKIGLKNHLNRLLTSRRNSYISSVITVKSKMKDFEILDSAYLYFSNGINVLKNQIKEKSIINYHSKSAYHEFNKSYKIFKQFNSNEYIDRITNNETKNKFKNYIRLSNYITSYLTSRYDEALFLYNEAKKDEKVIIDAKKKKLDYAKNNSDDLKAQLQTMNLKYSNEEIIVSLMDRFYDHIIRDKRLYSIQKEYFNFYK